MHPHAKDFFVSFFPMFQNHIKLRRSLEFFQIFDVLATSCTFFKIAATPPAFDKHMHLNENFLIVIA